MLLPCWPSGCWSIILILDTFYKINRNLKVNLSVEKITTWEGNSDTIDLTVRNTDITIYHGLMRLVSGLVFPTPHTLPGLSLWPTLRKHSPLPPELLPLLCCRVYHPRFQEPGTLPAENCPLLLEGGDRSVFLLLFSLIFADLERNLWNHGFIYICFINI